MRINLGCGGDLRLHDFINVDILPNPSAPPEVYRQGDVRNLDWLCAAGQVDEIMAVNVLPCISYTEADEVLSHWVSRLKPGGVLKLSLPDIHWVAKSFAEDVIDLSRLVAILYGPQDHAHNGFRSCYDARTLCDRLTALGMKITVKRLAGFLCYVEAEKTEGD